MKDIIKAILPKELRVEASRPITVSGREVWSRKRIYTVINPEVRNAGEQEPQVLLGRLKRRTSDEIDYSFLVSQDELLRAFLFHEELRGLKLIPIDAECPPRGSGRLLHKVVDIVKTGINRARRVLPGTSVL
jgi:hypothetical protein